MLDIIFSHVIGIAIGWALGQVIGSILVRRIERKGGVKGTPGENHAEEDSET